jgi:RNA polymerase subunit RPABC4/transcription elongation factor Spt4
MVQGSSQSATPSARSAVMEQAAVVAGEMPVPQLRSLVCPYCGTITPDSGRCSACSGRFDPLSRQATQNQMGPWSIRDDRLPFRPGCTYETVVRLVEQRVISTETILRGPSTRQFWTLARHTPGVAHMLGLCYSCQTPVKTDAFACPVCHASFTTERDRQHLGLGPSRPLPGQGLPEVLALHAEPASQPGSYHSGVVSTPIDTRTSLDTGISPNGRAAGAHGGRGSSADEAQQIEDANRNARKWRSAWRLERRRAWMVMSVMGAITVLAVVYAIFVSFQSDRPLTMTKSAQIDVLSSE